MAGDEEGERRPLDRTLQSEPISPEEQQRTAKYKYGGVMLLTFLVTVIVRWISDNSSFLKFLPALDDKCDGNGQCLGYAAVYRFSFALFLFYLCHLVLASPLGCCFEDEQKAAFFGGLWCIKAAVYALLCVVCFLLPSGLFEGYAYMSVGLAVVFLIMQAIIVIAFAYDWNERWTNRSGWNNEFGGDTDARFGRGIVCVTGLLYAFALTWVGLMYHWFMPSGCSASDKSLNGFLITFTLVCAVLYTLASIKIEGASIMCSGVIFAYTAWTCYSGIISNDNGDKCNEIYTDSGKVSASVLVQLLVAAATLTYTALNTGGSQSAFSMRSDDGEQKEKFSWTFFFVAMCVGAGYLAMVLTSWTVDKGVSGSGGDANPLRVDNSKTSMWAKIGSEWLAILLFCQTLWAPFCCGQNGLCCKDRDFSV
eukprot:TRINITY_DN12224_c0_g1_i1.p1 TRINITY_DN12224_c0_g1~~TRINITY_DN12224_c0_g1_i1.p1  ORF type:complete len:448 (+),score=164.65 TRINITY_DN12224_c0_g1_i1:79-1344(+)